MELYMYQSEYDEVCEGKTLEELKVEYKYQLEVTSDFHFADYIKDKIDNIEHRKVPVENEQTH